MSVRAGNRDVRSEIETYREQHRRRILKIRGIDSIDDAESLIGADVRIASAELPPLYPDHYFSFQLKGCAVHTTGGDHVGTVTAILDYGGTEILQVDGGGMEILIPFAKEFLRNIDLDGRRIDVDLPEELRELNT